jgi:hypothetical protein
VLRNDSAPYNGNLQAIIRNNIISGNGTNVDDRTRDGSTKADYNLIGGDPRFVDPANGNFRLQADSPAIDVGVALPAVTADADGVPRPQGAAYDMGAYEASRSSTLPGVTIDDVSLAEGNAGTTALSFTVTLTQAATSPVAVDSVTADGTATAASGDYATTSGVITFPPGTTTPSLTVTVYGDTIGEPDETLVVRLSGQTDAFLLKAQGVGTILNDDSITRVIGLLGTLAFGSVLGSPALRRLPGIPSKGVRPR